MRRQKAVITDGVLVCDVQYRCWDEYMNGYTDIVIPRGKKVKVHIKNGVPVKINALEKEILKGGNIYLDVAQYGQFVNLL